MKKSIVLSIVALLCLVSCTDEQRSRETLQKAGFTEVQITGYSWMACADSDDFHTGFRAKNPSGVLVDGTVCCGLTKACTIRF